VARGIQSCDVELRVRYAETDAMGYLHHSAYFVYFELGRTELLRLNGLRYRDMEERGLFYVVARVDCRYRAPARYDDLLRLETTATRVTPVRVDHAYRLFRDDKLLAEASSTLVLVDRYGQPTRMPDEWFEVLAGTPDSSA
jgi:acyl-CoA thioester hydrolase